ncbi:hypothetical protein [Nocardia sp. NRRL S-836]|uniref:hypothetical protein n=1 Tax=Nocardia sp. NRRL S-836 TaxID=1519492 RepID=UPI0006AFEB56|nr:hypothetical protein [Nocardia sp. NRRL S-836]KOV88327.1 hypothetical protein ADL03_05540 [Nocardia sp. NRRL S-836]
MRHGVDPGLFQQTAHSPSYFELARTGVGEPEASIRPNVVVVKSLGKNFGPHGIRFGHLVANPGWTDHPSHSGEPSPLKHSA